MVPTGNNRLTRAIDRLEAFAGTPAFLVFLFFAAVLTRGIGVYLGGARADDDGTYLLMARRYLDGLGLSLLNEGHVKYAYQPPGMAMLHIVFITAFGSLFHLAERVFTVLLSSSFAIGFFFLARKMFSLRTSAVLALLWVLYPPQWFWTTRLYPHTYALPLVLFTFLWMFRIWRRRSLIEAFVVGLVWAVIALLRAEYILGLGCIGVVTLITVRPTRRAVLIAGALSVGWLVGMAPWTIRTHRLVGHWVYVATHGGITSWMVFSPDYKYEGDMFWPTGELAARLDAQTDEVVKDEIYAAEVRRMIREEPLRCAKQLFFNFLNFWRPWLSFKITPAFEQTVYMASYLPLFFLFLAGLCRVPWREPAWMLVGSWAFMQMAVHIPFVMIVRYRENVFPYMLLIAGACLARYIDRQPAAASARSAT